MKRNPYARFAGKDLILRDELALDRTVLANERTLLAYLRSGVALMLAGATLLHFAEAGWLSLVGLLCIPLGVVVCGIGVRRWRRMERSIGAFRRAIRRRAKRDS